MEQINLAKHCICPASMRQFFSKTRSSHKHAMLKMAPFLIQTRSQEMLVWPTNTFLELWCSADFCGNRDPDTANSDITTAKSRTSFIIIFRVPTHLDIKIANGFSHTHRGSWIYFFEKMSTHSNSYHEPDRWTKEQSSISTYSEENTGPGPLHQYPEPGQGRTYK